MKKLFPRLYFPINFGFIFILIIGCSPSSMDTRQYHSQSQQTKLVLNQKEAPFHHFSADTIDSTRYSGHIASEIQKPVREVFGFYTEEEDTLPSSAPTLAAHHENISMIAPFTYKLDEEKPGHLKTDIPVDVRKKVIEHAHSRNIKVELLVHNLFYGSNAVGKQVARNILRYPHIQKTFFDELQKEILSLGYDGVNIDIENLFLEDKEAFTRFIKELSAIMHQHGKSISVNVPANTGDDRANPWSPWFDYKELSRSVDRLIIMAYDEHNPRTVPGPVASFQWVEDTICYALNQNVPANKILLGVAGYGWDWSSTGEKAAYTTYSKLHAHMNKPASSLQWDSTHQSPHLNYQDASGNMHVAWFENSFSLRFKLALVEKYNLSGIALWRLGLEDPAIWNTLSSRIKVAKLVP
ncbi:glycosyl hydrolase family 18 protein [Brevibacillus daliensis]|uniref:glycosyl hydrolase family 18 protein n=1 Tax=Brevibacillus daliensis TaxID=2892995 RepID=UPI001E649B38|nr:glycosyl hydrolase family 18 protein [Brevibacillus daliensis]